MDKNSSNSVPSVTISHQPCTTKESLKKGKHHAAILPGKQVLQMKVTVDQLHKMITLSSYLPMPFMPAEPRLRHCNLNLSIGSIFPLLFSIFLHFCFISESDLAVAAMLFLYGPVNKYGALSKSRRF